MNIKNINIITNLFYSAFNSAFVAVVSFVYKSEFFTKLEILDSSTDPFSFMFVSRISFQCLIFSRYNLFY